MMPTPRPESLQQLRRVVLDRYEILRELGRGGMAVVYLAHDLRHQRQVALKVFAPAFGGSEGAERFHREIAAMARLRHPHILPLHDSGEADGCLYYVMPFVEGESLRGRLARQPLPVIEALCVVREVADALAHAHRHGIVHRDIKPENILLADGHATVADFGIAHMLSESHASITQAGSTVGTPLYMSPEQAAGEREVDGRSDIYSLGCVLFEMLTGTPLFHAGSLQGSIAARFTHPPPSLRELRSDAPPELDEILHRMLVPDPAHRPAAADMLEALSRLEATIVHGGAVPAGNVATSQPPASLGFRAPQPIGSFIGRDDERRVLRHLMRQPEVRLVTLTGPGGAGKTRLALQLAGDVRDNFPNGVAFIDLSTTLGASQLVSTIAATLGVREHEERSALDALRMHIADRRVLLVLDNFEQLVDAAPQVAALLAACPRLSVLVTSRLRLRLQGEHEFPVPPLRLPDARSATDSSTFRDAPAIRLFLARAAEIRPGYDVTDAELRTIAEICERLDGLPLALELAAARVALLTPAAMLARLDRRLDFLKGGRRDAPERHRTLQSAIAWSNDLLNERERLFFRRLASFAGGCPLPALATVCLDNPVAEDDALELTESLLEKSLLRRVDSGDEPRVAMLETIREFALGHLHASGEEAATLERHARWFAGFAEHHASDLSGAEQAGHLASLARENANLQHALAWALRANDAELAARLGRSLWRSWLIRGRLTEGRERMERVLALPGVPARMRAQLLNALAVFAQNQGDYAAAYAHLDESLTLWRALDDKPGLAAALTSLGWIAFRRGRYAEALTQSREGLALHRELGQLDGAARALTNQVMTTIFMGDYDRARALGAESLELRRRTGDPRDIGFGLTTLGLAIGRQGDRAAAEQLLEEALDLYREVGERQLLAWTVAIVVEISDDSAPAGAAELVEQEAIPIFREIGDRWGLGYALNVIGSVRLHKGALHESVRAHLDSLRYWEALDDSYGVGTTSAHLALVAAAAQRADLVAVWGDASTRFLSSFGGALAPALAARLEKALRDAHAALGDRLFREALRKDSAETRAAATELLALLPQRA